MSYPRPRMPDILTRQDLVRAAQHWGIPGQTCLGVPDQELQTRSSRPLLVSRLIVLTSLVMSLGAGALRQLINLGWAVSSWEWSRGGVNGAQCDEFIRVSTFLVPDNTGTNYLTWGETKYARKNYSICFFKSISSSFEKTILWVFRRGNIIIICSPDNDPNDVKSQQASPQSPAGRGESNVVSDPGLTSDCGKHVNNSNNYPAMLFVIQ